MAQIGKNMSNITKSTYYILNLEPPDVKILQYNYFHGVTSWNYPVLSSPFWYLWHNDEAGACLIYEKQTIELLPDRTLLIPPNTIFSTRSGVRPFDQFYIHFTTGESFPAVRRAPLVFPAESIFSPDPKEFFHDVMRHAENRLQLSMRLYEVLFRALAQIPEEWFLSGTEKKMDDRIVRAVQFMNQSLGRAPGNREICSHIRMSENNFIRVFRKEMGISPQHYLLMRRIEWSRNLLLNSTLSIEEIAECTGFSDRYHFSKMFKYVTHCSPAAYRRQTMRISPSDEKSRSTSRKLRCRNLPTAHSP